MLRTRQAVCMRRMYLKASTGDTSVCSAQIFQYRLENARRKQSLKMYTSAGSAGAAHARPTGLVFFNYIAEPRGMMMSRGL